MSAEASNSQLRAHREEVLGKRKFAPSENHGRKIQPPFTCKPALLLKALPQSRPSADALIRTYHTHVGAKRSFDPYSRNYSTRADSYRGTPAHNGVTRKTRVIHECSNKLMYDTDNQTCHLTKFEKKFIQTSMPYVDAEVHSYHYRYIRPSFLPSHRHKFWQKQQSHQALQVHALITAYVLLVATTTKSNKQERAGGQ